MLIPDTYVSNIQERLILYTELDKLEEEKAIEQFGNMLRDRFGPVPAQVNELFDGLRLRTLAKKLGFERLVLKNRKMNGYFVSNPQSMYYETRTFQEIMRYVATQAPVAGISMKQSGKFLILTRENIKTLKQAKAVLESMLEFVNQPAD